MDRARLFATIICASVVATGSLPHAQTAGQKERFTAVAIVNNNLASGAGMVQIDVTRWSTQAERNALLSVLKNKGPEKLLDALQDTKPVGTIKTPDSLGYDLHYAQQTPTEEGGRRIVIATDRPIGFWEAANNRRTLDYPFTVIQMEIGRDGKGKGTLSYATKVIAQKDSIILENFASQPVMLTAVRAEQRDR
jgi:hypothetical protein